MGLAVFLAIGVLAVATVTVPDDPLPVLDVLSWAFLVAMAAALAWTVLAPRAQVRRTGLPNRRFTTVALIVGAVALLNAVVAAATGLVVAAVGLALGAAALVAGLVRVRMRR